MSGLQLVAGFAFFLFILLRLAIGVAIVAAVVDIVRILREPRYLPDAPETHSVVPL